MHKWVVFVFLTCLQLWPNSVEASALKFCTTAKKGSNKRDALNRACHDLKLNSSVINCVVTEDRMSCLRKLIANEADFTVLEPEDLLVTTLNYVDSNILITHELKQYPDNYTQYDVEMVAIVRNNFDNSWVTTNKKLCYIGFETGQMRVNYHYHYTSYFEKWIINRECDTNKTLLENRIADLSQHFESACIAGPWTLDSTFDGELKSKYRNLCALCGNPNGCYEGDRFYGMQGAIQCLLEVVGDIAWLSRSDASRYFSELASYGYSLLCPDGMFMPLSVNKTCTWIAEPRSVIAVRSDAVERVINKIADMNDAGKKFYPVIHASYKFSHLVNLTTPVDAEGYMKRFAGFLSSKVHSNCREARTIRWCVASNAEASKCGWMQAAAVGVDIEPRISCIQQLDRQAALRAVRDDRCDIFVAKPEEELHARSMNLTPIAHLISNKDLDANRFAAIVRKDAKFMSFAELKGAKACFTGYKSVGWNAFFSILRNGSSDVDCSDTRAMARFFGDSCVQRINESDASVPESLYRLCNQTKFDRKLGPEENAFKCLMSGGDVAFVNISAVKKYFSTFGMFGMNYKLLCENETLENPEPCFLAETTMGSVLANKNASNVKKEDIFLMLLALDRFFGKTHDRETPMFSLYGPFEGESDVIFPDRTMHLQKYARDLRHGRTYEDVLVSLQEKIECKSSSVALSFSLLLVSALAIFSQLLVSL
ncbi:transferrin-like [Copidosoma floridanum]|uniref:transferrin-like n=1 Tax=Copidosoma floridanum TaxID=29053 RepID=UPI0006C986B2|nr:transferrin-like [Copidosoma floridanum]